MTSLKDLLGVVLLLLAGHAFAMEPVNINEADAETLATVIKDVGIIRAEAIIAYREQHGPFISVGELAEVQGIGETLLESNRDNLTVQSSGG
ncbi:MAG: hypothetical protein CMO26_18555 [Thiotrichales bacterium]|nr:hypothetical protein [Thiotrichales bacterium]